MNALNRRNFIKVAGSASVLAAAPINLYATGAAPKHTLVIVYQRGGMDGLSAVVPYTENDYYTRRASISVPRPGAAGGVLDLDGKFGLHPALSALKPFWDRRQLAVVPAAGLITPSRSHFDAQDFMERAWMAQGGVFTGWLNRHMSSAPSSAGTFRGVGVGTAVARSLSGPEPTIGLSSINSFTVQSRSTRKDTSLDTLEATFSPVGLMEGSALRAFGAIDALSSKNLGALPVENSAAYPGTEFGRRLTDLARLIKGDIGVEVAAVDIGGWDTHDNQPARLQTLLTELGNGLAAFATDLGTRMNQVTVITMTEFGRRVQQNASNGTDHGRASVMFALGGKVIGKQIYGEWPTLASNRLEDGDLRVTTDYRAVLAEALAKPMGSSKFSDVFPGWTAAPTQGLFIS